MTRNRFILGIMPMGVMVPRGETTWIASLSETPRFLANSTPRIMPGESLFFFQVLETAGLHIAGQISDLSIRSGSIPLRTTPETFDSEESIT